MLNNVNLIYTSSPSAIMKIYWVMDDVGNNLGWVLHIYQNTPSIVQHTFESFTAANTFAYELILNWKPE